VADTRSGFPNNPNEPDKTAAVVAVLEEEPAATALYERLEELTDELVPLAWVVDFAVELIPAAEVDNTPNGLIDVGIDFDDPDEETDGGTGADAWG
jgi:hypothetical protein